MRAKIIVGNLIAILIVGLGAYALAKQPLEHAFLDEVDSRLADDYQLLERSVRLNSRELLGLVTQVAAERPLREVFAALDENGRRNRAFDQAERVTTWFGDPARGRGGPPSIVAITDDAGRVVSRNADRNRMYAQDLRTMVPAITSALTGTPAVDVWELGEENLVMLIGTAPIRNEEGRVIGALLVGYDLSNGLADTEADRLHREVAFVSGERVYGSSMSESAEALHGYLFGEGLASTTGAQGGAVSGTFLVTLGGREYAGVIGPLASTSGHVAVAVLGDRTAQIEKASPINYVLIFMGVGLVLALVYGFFIGGSLLRPVEQMEETILNVINGRQDLRVQVESAEYGGLAYRINQLLNMFTGTPEADESGRLSSPPAAPSGGRWDDGGAPGGGAAPAGGGGDEEADPETAAKLSAEPEETYYARVFNEYVAAKQAAGENVGAITQDKFVQRLKSNEQALVKKHGCRMVRFEVQVKGTQVNLKPVIIR